MVSKTHKVHLMHASMLRILTPAKYGEDVEYIISQDPDMVSMTEVVDNHGIIRDVCKNTDYRPVFFANNQHEAFLVKISEHSRLRGHANIMAHQGDGSNQITGPGSGGYPNRYVSWVHVKYWDEDVWYHTGHWVAGVQNFNSEQRVNRSNRMSQRMAIQVRKHSQGDHVSFFSGDVNQDDVPVEDARKGEFNSIFRSAGLLTMWDENSVYPPTHGRSTIDVIGRYTPDKKVKNTRYKVHPKQNSDHRFISGWYEIPNTQGSNHGGGNSGGGGGGGGGNPDPGTGPTDPDFYATGGNVDFSDYADGEVYDLPQAVDDSDGSNH